MRKAEVQTTQKRAAEAAEVARFGGVEPPIPPKRFNKNQEAAPRQPQPSPTPPVFLRKMRNAAVGTGCDIRLKVGVGGDPQPSLYWYHNDQLLNMDNQEYGGLWIRDCKPGDAGLYTCIANNHLGEVRSSAVLAVLDLGEDSFSSLDFSTIYDELNFTYNYTEFIHDPITKPCESTPISDAVMIGVSVFYVLIFLLAIPGNLVVGLVIGLNPQPLSPSDLYLFNLAVADILLAVTLPFWATSVTLGWVFGDAMCKLVSILQGLSFYVSILFLACISVDRYLAIVRAMDARKANRKLASWCVCAAVWLAGGLLSLPGFWNSATPSTNSSNGSGPLTMCAEHYDPSSANEWRLATRALCHTLGFILPLAVMLLCYGVTVRRLLHTKGGFQRQRAMRVIVAVVVAFLLCWMPYHMSVIADTFLRARIVLYNCPTRNAIDCAMFATQSLGLLHSCVNPVLYAFVGEKFRRRLEHVVKKTRVLDRTSMSSRPSRSSVSLESRGPPRRLEVARFGGVEPPIPPKRFQQEPGGRPPRQPQPSPTPPVFLRKMRNAAVGTGCDIRLKVGVGGDPQPSLYWYHNDQLLNMDNQEYGGLWIRDCKPGDAGLYTCIANNHLGEGLIQLN
ncbi:hypothetical protein CRUP_000351 [Coryphaenoides rupestris]|nr:hypothetical protein CRUP_000351 [Coryphaenoides rupestris]